MVAIALIGFVSASAVQLGAAQGQRGAEEQLLFTGAEIQLALNRYAEATPAGLPRSPLSLEELVRDPRYPGIVRHLRRVPADPFVGGADWAVVQDTYGRVLAVHSRSKLKPLKTAGFDLPLGYLEGREARSYEDWVFWGPMKGAAQIRLDRVLPQPPSGSGQRPGIGMPDRVNPP